MAKRPVISTLSTDVSGLDSPLNNNFTNVQDAFDNTLSRDGSTPNQMNADLDLNSNDIINIKDTYTQRLFLNGTAVTTTVNEDVSNPFVLMSTQVGATPYLRLVAALSAATFGQTVYGEYGATVDTLGATITVPSGVTLDLNNMTITSSVSVDIFLETESNAYGVTIKNGKFDGGGNLGVSAANNTSAIMKFVGVSSLALENIYITNYSFYGIWIVGSTSRGCSDVQLNGIYFDKPALQVIYAILVSADTTTPRRHSNFVFHNIISWGTDPNNPSVQDYTASNQYTADNITLHGIKRLSISNVSVYYSGSAGLTVSRACENVTVKNYTAEMCYEPGYNFGSGFFFTHLADITGWQEQSVATYASTPLPATSVATGGTARVDSLVADSTGTGGWVGLQAVSGSSLGDPTTVGDDWTQDGNATVVDTAGATEQLGEVGRSVLESIIDAKIDQISAIDTYLTTLSKANISSITNANPGVVTLTTGVPGDYNIDEGELVIIEDSPITEINGKWLYATNISSNTFELYDGSGNAIDTTNYTAYTSGGTVRQRPPLSAFNFTRPDKCYIHNSVVANPRGLGQVTHAINNANGTVGYSNITYENRAAREISASRGYIRKTGSSSWLYQDSGGFPQEFTVSIPSTGASITATSGFNPIIDVRKVSTGNYRLITQDSFENDDYFITVRFDNFGSTGVQGVAVPVNEFEFDVMVREIHPVETQQTITGIAESGGVLTVTTSGSHGWQNGDSVYIADVVGMTEVNGRSFFIKDRTATTFVLDNIDGTGYTAYTSGGTAIRTHRATGSKIPLADRAFRAIGFSA